MHGDQVSGQAGSGQAGSGQAGSGQGQQASSATSQPGAAGSQAARAGQADRTGVAGNATFAREAEQPRLPLPSLADSCTRFLDWCAPLLDAQQLAETEAAVAGFMEPASPAHALQAELERYAARPDVDSWLDEFWRDRYLGRRVRTAINANFFFLFRDGETDPCRRAAALIMAALDHHDAIATGRFPVTEQRGEPLSMEGHKYLFSSARLPGVTRDSCRAPFSEQWPGPSSARHIVVFVNGNLYRLDVIGPDGRPHSLAELSEALAGLAGAGQERGQAVGHLTSLDRAEWAVTREALLACDPHNRQAMETIETALFGLCLERGMPADRLEVCQRLLCGDSGSRWFDLAITFIVFPDGSAGINGEHTALDGTTVAEFIASLMASSEVEHAQQLGAAAQGPVTSQPITFVLDQPLRDEIDRADQAFRACAAQTSGRLFRFDEFGANRAKALGLSPDAFIQIAYQLAHWRAKGRLGATYESVSNRRYRRGRTEAMRVVTPEIVRAVAAIEDPASSPQERGTWIRAAAQRHVERARQCQASEAPEQHLWELLLIQQRQGRGMPPALFDTPGWRILRDDYLSTSSVPSVVDALGFGATSGHCIGIAYQFQPEYMAAYLSTPTAELDGLEAFIEALPQAMRDLAAALEQSPEKKKEKTS